MAIVVVDVCIFLILDKSKFLALRQPFLNRTNTWKKKTHSNDWLWRNTIGCRNSGLWKWRKNVDMEFFAVHVIPTYVTFYRTVIPASYWRSLMKVCHKSSQLLLKDGQRKMAYALLRTGRKKRCHFIKIRKYLLNDRINLAWSFLFFFKLNFFFSGGGQNFFLQLFSKYTGHLANFDVECSGARQIEK